MVLVLVVLVYVVYALVRSVPGPTVVPVRVARALAGRSPALTLPSQGEAAAAVVGSGLIGSSGADAPTPIASVAKVMTAYLVLRDHPLVGNEQGPILLVTAGDVRAYRRDAVAGQSVLPVRTGERLSERDALEGLLLPSGNNVATLLAAWDAGGQRAFVAKMNAQARVLGMTNTRYTSASGLAASTVSTALDQLHLARLAFAVPVFRHIVGLAEATLPVAGRQFNVDSLLGHDGIVGIKTGTTSQAGGCFVFAAHVHVGRRTVTVIGDVLHQLTSSRAPSLVEAAFAATVPLLASVSRSLHVTTVLKRGRPLAIVSAPWSTGVDLDAARAVRVLGWGGLAVTTSIPLAHRLPASIQAGEVIAIAHVSVGDHRAVLPLVAAKSLGGPSFGWRLTHP